MTTITITKASDGIYKWIECNGHAGFAEYGEDIVCAASSATILTSINAILLISRESIDVKQNNNNIDLTIIEEDINTMKLIDNMLASLKSIQNDYPKNIEIIEEEIKWLNY